MTARDSLEDRVKGLDFGGDDYIVKPFQAPELKVRIRALLRRSGSLTTQQTIRYKGIELFGKDKDVQVDGKGMKLSLKQYELLEYLVQNSGKILMREQIFDRVWGFDSDTTVAIVEVYVHHLRKKIRAIRLSERYSNRSRYWIYIKRTMKKKEVCFKKTRIRLTIVNSLVFILLIGILGSIIYSYTYKRIYSEVDQSIKMIAQYREKLDVKVPPRKRMENIQIGDPRVTRITWNGKIVKIEGDNRKFRSIF